MIKFRINGFCFLELGPGANYRAKVKKNESFKETSMTTRPITVEKPLKAKQARHAMNNEEAKSHAFHSGSGHQPQNMTNAGDDEHYNRRKGIEPDDMRRNNGQPGQRFSPTEKSRKLEQILNMPDVATDVDTGEPIFVEEKEKHRYKQMSKRNHSASDEHSFSGRRYVIPIVLNLLGIFLFLLVHLLCTLSTKRSLHDIFYSKSNYYLNMTIQEQTAKKWPICPSAVQLPEQRDHQH